MVGARFLWLVGMLVLLTFASTSWGQVVEWQRQLGTHDRDFGLSVAADSLGNVYLAGRTGSTLGGPHAGLDDAMVAKYDTAGNLAWIRQAGGHLDDSYQTIAVDPYGNIYAAGYSGVTLAGEGPNEWDAIVRKYNTAGDLQWERQFEAEGWETIDAAASDMAGNLYVTGRTDYNLGVGNNGGYDAFVAKLNQAGTVLWSHLIGSNDFDFGDAIGIDDSGNVYVSGTTNFNLWGDAFVAKLTEGGDFLWTRQFGGERGDWARGLATDDDGNLYVIGRTTSELNSPHAGAQVAYISKLDDEGAFQWTRQIGITPNDTFHGLARALHGGVFVAGTTEGDLFGDSLGGKDAFVAHFDPAGNLTWGNQFGSSADDISEGLAIDGWGNLFHTGYTYGDLAGPNAGLEDLFLVKYSRAVPEVNSAILASAATTLLCFCARRSVSS